MRMRYLKDDLGCPRPRSSNSVGQRWGAGFERGWWSLGVAWKMRFGFWNPRSGFVGASDDRQLGKYEVDLEGTHYPLMFFMSHNVPKSVHHLGSGPVMKITGDLIARHNAGAFGSFCYIFRRQVFSASQWLLANARNKLIHLGNKYYGHTQQVTTRSIVFESKWRNNTFTNCELNSWYPCIVPLPPGKALPSWLCGSLFVMARVIVAKNINHDVNL